ncbi:hypothetical protein DEJ30_08130 [Curtobacterium sp. MCPF17_003]|uniref:hypothetical protein n=1 Tax=Curtobacterium sp. MCPF17_003 TaxID=2175637 RepID=UPI000D83A947|nr:hypothetical protein [Curtobacterium sp. MCPF17_003]PYY64423.1 hypothetical protein DEJ30_08130 [Curtobacterium sp. MCPF17_003]
MTERPALWFMNDDGELHRYRRDKAVSEEDLRLFIEAHPETLGDVIILGRDVKTHGHGDVDLVAIDSDGQLWVIELKLKSATRKIMEQTIGYASWGKSASLRDLANLYAAYSGGTSLSDEFERRFGKRLPGRAERGLIVATVASKTDEHAHCQLEWLEGHGGPVRAYEYAFLYADGIGIEGFEMQRVCLHGHDR